MTDQTPDAAREAEIERLYDEAAKATGWGKLRIRPWRECQGHAKDAMREFAKTYAAAVSRARDAAWRSAVEELMGEGRYEYTGCRSRACNHPKCAPWNSALAALLNRMDTSGGANG